MDSYIALAGRVLYAVPFILFSFGHFSSDTVTYAAGQGVPMAEAAVPLSGVMALVGGLSVLVGYQARIGAWLLVAFLIPVTAMMHNFWTITDPMMAQMQRIEFLKNTSMLGGALLIAHFGPGRLSLDGMRRK
jgi:putative oxidoreductase